jgi:hypothetical protein
MPDINSPGCGIKTFHSLTELNEEIKRLLDELNNRLAPASMDGITGTGGRLAPEWAHGLLRNGWTAWIGVSGRLEPEYVLYSPRSFSISFCRLSYAESQGPPCVNGYGQQRPTQ